MCLALTGNEKRTTNINVTTAPHPHSQQVPVGPAHPKEMRKATITGPLSSKMSWMIALISQRLSSGHRLSPTFPNSPPDLLCHPSSSTGSLCNHVHNIVSQSRSHSRSRSCKNVATSAAAPLPSTSMPPHGTAADSHSHTLPANGLAIMLPVPGEPLISSNSNITTYPESQAQSHSPTASLRPSAFSSASCHTVVRQLALPQCRTTVFKAQDNWPHLSARRIRVPLWWHSQPALTRPILCPFPAVPQRL